MGRVGVRGMGRVGVRGEGRDERDGEGCSLHIPVWVSRSHIKNGLVF